MSKLRHSVALPDANATVRTAIAPGIGRIVLGTPDALSFVMSQRAHFWLRIAGLCVIVLAQVFPHLTSRDAAPRAQSAASAEVAGVPGVAGVTSLASR